MADKDLTKPTEIEFCTGSFSAVDTAVFKAVGGFDEAYCCTQTLRPAFP